MRYPEPGLRPCNDAPLRATTPLRSWLRSEPRVLASGFGIAPNLAVAALVLALAGAFLLTGCSSFVSFEPFVTEDQAATDGNLVGAWQGAGNDDKDLTVIRQKGSAYSIRWFGDDKDVSIGFEGRLMRVGDVELMDIVVTNDNTFSIPVHMLARVWPEGGTLRWVFLDSGWLEDHAKQSLATQEAGDRTVVTTKGAALVQFLKKFAIDEKAYSSEMQHLVRVQ